jgi:hypothetical protein
MLPSCRVEHVVAALRSVVETDALELAWLAAIRFPGDPEAKRTNEVATSIPEEPEVADPSGVKRASVDDGWRKHDVEQMYDDNVQAALGSVVDDRRGTSDAWLTTPRILWARSSRRRKSATRTRSIVYSHSVTTSCSSSPPPSPPGNSPSWRR